MGMKLRTCCSAA